MGAESSKRRRRRPQVRRLGRGALQGGAASGLPAATTAFTFLLRAGDRGITTDFDASGRCCGRPCVRAGYASLIAASAQPLAPSAAPSGAGRAASQDAGRPIFAARGRARVGGTALCAGKRAGTGEAGGGGVPADRKSNKATAGCPAPVPTPVPPCRARSSTVHSRSSCTALNSRQGQPF